MVKCEYFPSTFFSHGKMISSRNCITVLSVTVLNKYGVFYFMKIMLKVTLNSERVAYCYKQMCYCWWCKGDNSYKLSPLHHHNSNRSVVSSKFNIVVTGIKLRQIQPWLVYSTLWHAYYSTLGELVLNNQRMKYKG